MTAFNIFRISGIVITISSMLMAILLFLKGSQKVTRLWGCLCILTIFWGFGAYKFSSTTNYESALFWWQIAYICVIFTPVLYYHFVYAFLNLSKKFYKTILILAYCFGFIFLVFDLFYREIFIKHLRFVFNQFYWHDLTKTKSLISLIFYISFYWFLLGFSFFLIVLAYSKSTGLSRNQLKYFVLGSIVGWLGPHGDYLIAFGFNIYPYLNFLIAVYLFIFSYAIIKYRLMDIKIAITRTGVFVAVYSLILGTPLLIIYYLQNQLVGLLGVSWWIVPFLCSTALATLGPFLFIYFNKKAEDRLLKEQKNYQNILRAASAGMIRIRNLDFLLKLIVYIVAKIVKIKHVAVYLLDNENQRFSLRASRASQQGGIKYFNLAMESPLIQKLIADRETIIAEEVLMKSRDEPKNTSLAELSKQLSDLGAFLAIPSFIEDRLIGILLLGEKRSGKFYSQDDLAVFSVLANQMAISVENILSFEELKGAKTQINHLEKLAAVGKLAHAVAHEINNPLAAIKTFTEHLEDNYDNQDFRTKFKRIVCSEIDRISRVVSHLFNLSKQRMPQLQHYVDIHQLLDSVVVLLGQELTKRGISLIKNYESDVVLLEVDPDQLKQCFLNLIINSMQAFEDMQERREIVVSTHRLDQKRFCITISDTGKGIAEDEMPRIFEPFFTTKKDGHGVGLSIVSDIIKAHGGEVKVESKLGDGTTFNVELPLQKTVA